MCDGFLAGRNFDTENSTFLTLNETGGGCSNPPINQPEDPQKGLQTPPNFVIFPISI